MVNKDDELKYKDVIDSLKGLQKVNAPSSFETDLMREINSPGTEEKKSFWERFFVPSRLIPSAALAVTAVILLFVLNTDGDDENPLLVDPKVRADIISSDNISEVQLIPDDDLAKQENEGSESSGLDKFRNEGSNTGSQKGNPGLSISTVDYSIDKKGLNFRQVNLSKEEKESLTRVKNRFIKLIESVPNN